MQPAAPSITPRRSPLAPLRITVARLMIWIAVFAIVLSAWLFSRRNSSVEQATVSMQIAALSDADAARRAEGADSLRVVNRASLPQAMPALIGALSDPDWEVRRTAARSLADAVGRHGGVRNGDLGPEVELATSALIPVFDDPRAEVRIAAIHAVGLLHDTFRSTPLAAGTLAAKPSFGAQGERARESLIRLIKDAAPDVQAEALWTLARLEHLSGGGSAILRDYAANGASPAVRIAAIRALVRGWPGDPLAYPLLLGRLEVVTDPDEHAEIAWSFRDLWRPPDESVGPLLEALATGDAILRQSIPTALGRLGALAAPALPALAPIAREELADPSRRLEAVKAIILIDPGSAEAQSLLAPLVALLLNPKERVRDQQAALLLSRFGASGAPAIALLRQGIKRRGEPSKARSWAAVVLEKLEAAARKDSAP
jgi:HEAT repeat protein